jgi:hypothetical protein
MLHRYLMLLLAFSPTSLWASNVNVECFMSTGNYFTSEPIFKNKKLTLKGLKHQSPHGAIKVFELQHYQFWVMNYSLANIDNNTQVTSLQVAIKNMISGEFYHALSNIRNFSSNDRLQARISLVKYFDNSMLEDSELLFECKTPLMKESLQ